MILWRILKNIREIKKFWVQAVRRSLSATEHPEDQNDPATPAVRWNSQAIHTRKNAQGVSGRNGFRESDGLGSIHSVVPLGLQVSCTQEQSTYPSESGLSPGTTTAVQSRVRSSSRSAWNCELIREPVIREFVCHSFTHWMVHSLLSTASKRVKTR